MESNDILFGIAKKYEKLMKICYDKMLLKVRFQQRLSPAFEVDSELRQGNALSLTLFNLELEKVIRKSYEDQRMKIILAKTLC